MTQVFPAASVLPHVVVETAKSPLATMLVMFNVALPVFLSVTLFAALVTPSTMLPKARDVGVGLWLSQRNYDNLSAAQRARAGLEICAARVNGRDGVRSHGQRRSAARRRRTGSQRHWRTEVPAVNRKLHRSRRSSPSRRRAATPAMKLTAWPKVEGFTLDRTVVRVLPD